MACYKPLRAYRSFTRKTENGKDYIAFDCSEISDHAYEEIWLPCGQCIGCRIARSRAWALRCVHESTLHSDNCFITLTFDDAHLVSGSLDKADFQRFMKRLRKRFAGVKIRYFHCGEYGSKLMRPHHHAAIFGMDFPDKELWTVRDNIRLYRSAILEELWPFGFCTVGSLTYESAAYIARYCTKKINGKKSILHYSTVDEETGEMSFLTPEYITMSRRPGIARNWIELYSGDVYPKDSCHVKGKEFRPPKYYDKIYDLNYPKNMIKIKRIRLIKMKACADNYTPERLNVREGVLAASVKKLTREYEI